MSEGPQWDGVGLPPAAMARMQRFRADGIRTSLLDARGAVSTEAVGLRPIGEVMGCIVEHIGWTGWGGCGYYGYGRMGSPFLGASATVTSGGAGAGIFGGYRPYVDALYRGYDTAIARMLMEATAMGADGVLGARISVNHLGQDNREFVVLGTAVRSEGRVHPAQPFVTDLSGADVAKLLHAGWVPASIAFGIAMAVRHDDWATIRQSQSWGQNTEVFGYTELVTHVRSDARQRFHHRAARAGADAALVSGMDLRIWAHEPGEGHRDHVAESTVYGTTVARFARRRSATTNALSILPLRP